MIDRMGAVETEQAIAARATNVMDLIAALPDGDPGNVSPVPEDDADAFFHADHIHDASIEVDPEQLALIDSDPSAEQYIQAELSLDGESLGLVGLRYKGSAGAFLAPCTAATFPGMMTGPKVGKCSMKVDFDRVDSARRFHGLKKLNLHAMGRDPSMLREQLGYGLFREVGIATPRTTYVRVVVNGELEGLFLGVEQIDGRFTHSRFTEGGDGNLYKEVWPSVPDESRLRAALETNEGPDTSVRSMLSFARAIQLDPKAALDWLDQDYMQRYIAVDRLILNDDGVFRWYCFAAFGVDLGGGWNHNYYWYESPVGNRVWLIPWDLDLSFAGAARVRIDREWRDDSDCACHTAEGAGRAAPQRAPACDNLTGEIGRWLTGYDAYVDEVIDGPFAADVVDGKLARWTELIGPAVEEAAGVRSAPSVSEWQQAVAELRAIIDHSRQTRGLWPDP